MKNILLLFFTHIGKRFSFRYMLNPRGVVVIKKNWHTGILTQYIPIIYYTIINLITHCVPIQEKMSCPDPDSWGGCTPSPIHAYEEITLLCEKSLIKQDKNPGTDRNDAASSSNDK